MLERVSFTSSTGGDASGVLALPSGTEAGPAIVVLQEWWGVNDQIQAQAQRFADEGFVALVPDLYHGVVAKDAAEAGQMMKSLDWPKALDEIDGAVEYLRKHPRSTGNIAVCGFCMGGALSFATACRVRGLSAVVPYYGLPPGGDWANVDAPVLAHFARRDDWAKPELATKIQEQICAAGGSMELRVYDADHAFCNERRPEVYSPEAAALSWQRTLDFLRAHT
jgi:carboxymethylenebutenolidase